MKGVRAGRAGEAARTLWFALWAVAARRWFQNRAYTVHVPYGYRVFTPWFSAEAAPHFAEAYRHVTSRDMTTMPADRCYMLYQLCRSCLALDGDVAECGVYRGGTAYLLAGLIARHGRDRALHLFDTFAGMPDSARAERDYHAPGSFADTSLAQVAQQLQAFPFVRFHPGVMPDSFRQVDAAQRYAFAHLDVDIYPSMLACCQWFWPRLLPGGMMVFDDYGLYTYRRAARAAVDDFFRDQPEAPLVLPTGQAVAIKR